MSVNVCLSTSQRQISFRAYCGLQPRPQSSTVLFLRTWKTPGPEWSCVDWVSNSLHVVSCYVPCIVSCHISLRWRQFSPSSLTFHIKLLCVLGLQWSPCVSCYVSCIVSCNIPLRWKQFSPSYLAYFSSLSNFISWVSSDARRPEVAFLDSGFAPNFLDVRSL